MNRPTDKLVPDAHPLSASFRDLYEETIACGSGGSSSGIDSSSYKRVDRDSHLFSKKDNNISNNNSTPPPESMSEHADRLEREQAGLLSRKKYLEEELTIVLNRQVELVKEACEVLGIKYPHEV